MNYNIIRIYLFIGILFLTSSVFCGIKTPINQQQGDWEQYASFLQQKINTLQPAACKPDNPPTIRANIRTLSLPIPDHIILTGSDQEQITQLDIIEYAYPPNPPYRNKDGMTYICLQQEKGKTLFTIPNKEDRMLWLELRETLPEYGATLDNIFYDMTMGIDPKLSSADEQDLDQAGCLCYWKGEIPVQNEDTYAEDTEVFYDNHRPELAKTMIDAMRNNVDVYQRAKKNGVQLFCLGCGSGRDLDTAAKAIEKEGIRYKGYGIEYYKTLAKRGSDRFPQYNFIASDAQKPAQLIRSEKVASPLNSDAPVIVMAEGFLARQVISGSEAGLAVLQELIQENVADLVVTGSLSCPLINSRMAIATGWDVTPLMFHYPSNPFATEIYIPLMVLVRPSAGKILENSLQRFRQCKLQDFEFTADLSMCGQTIQVLEHLINHCETDTVQSVDLSFSYLNDSNTIGQVEQVITILQRIPGLKQVILSGSESWYKTFLGRAKQAGCFKVAVRKDIGFNFELPVIATEMRPLLGLSSRPEVKTVYSPERSPSETKATSGAVTTESP